MSFSAKAISAAPGMARRILSILLYILGGIFLTGEAMIAFLDGSTKLMMLAVYVPFILFFLGAGASVSNGSRQRELGIVLLAAAGWSGFWAAAAVYLGS